MFLFFGEKMQKHFLTFSVDLLKVTEYYKQ